MLVFIVTTWIAEAEIMQRVTEGSKSTGKPYIKVIHLPLLRSVVIWRSSFRSGISLSLF